MRAPLLVAALALCVPSLAQAQSAKALVQAVAKRALAGGADVATATWSNSALDLDDVTVFDAERHVVARLGRVHAVLRPMALYAAGTIDDVEIEGVALNLRRMPDGRLGIGRLLRTGGSDSDFAIERAQIRGPLVVAIPGRPPITMTLDVAARLTRAGAATHVRLDRLIARLARSVVGGTGTIDVDDAGTTAKIDGQASAVPLLVAQLLGLRGAAGDTTPWRWTVKVDGSAAHATVHPPRGELTMEASANRGGWQLQLAASKLELADLVADATGVANATMKVVATKSATQVALDAMTGTLRVGEATASKLELHVDGDAEVPSGNVRLVAHDVGSGGLALGVVRVVAGGDRQRISVEASSESPHGSLRLQAAGVPSWRGGLPVAVDATLGLLRLDGRGQRWALTTPARLQIGRVLILDAITLARDGSAAEQVTLAGRIEPRSGQLDLRAMGRRLALRTIAGVLGAELALPEVALDVTARARGALGSPRVELTADGVAAPDVRLGGAAAAVHLRARLADGRIVGQTDVRAGEARLEARFDVASRRSHQPLRVHAHGEALPLAWLTPMVPGLAAGGRATLDVDLRGTRLEPRVVATLTARLAGGGALDARLRGALPATRAAAVAMPLDGEVTLRAVPLSLLMPKLTLPVAVDGTMRLTGTAEAPRLAGHVGARATTKIGAVDVQADVTWEDQFAASVAASLDGRQAVRGVARAPLPLSSLARGTLDRAALVAFDGTVPSFELAPLAPLGGTLAGTVTMRSPLEAPRLTAHLSASALTVAGAPLGPATVEVVADRDGARAELRARPPAGGALSVSARFADERSVRVVADRVELAAADPAGRLRVSGRIDGDVTLRDGKPRGSLRLSDGRARWLSERVDDLGLGLDFDGERLNARAQASYRRGRVSANAQILLDGAKPLAVDATLRTHELPLSRANVGLWLDSESTLRLSRDAEGLTGTLRIQRADAHVVRAGMGRTLQPTGPLADVVVVDRHAAAATAATVTLPRFNLPVRLRVELPGPAHIAGEEIEVAARAAFTLDTRGERPTLRGRAEALPGGRLMLFDRRYDIERAVLDFDRDAVEVDLAVTREMGDVALRLELQGALDAPRVHLTSDPPVYDERQIGALVLSGDARAEAVSSEQIGGRMAGIVTGLIAGRVRDKVAPSLPLDVVKLEPGATAATPSRLEVGKFIFGDRLYVSYAYQFGGLTLPTRRLNAHQAQLQLKLVRRLSLDARYGDAGAGALDLTFSLRR